MKWRNAETFNLNIPKYSQCCKLFIHSILQNLAVSSLQCIVECNTTSYKTVKQYHFKRRKKRYFLYKFVPYCLTKNKWSIPKITRFSWIVNVRNIFRILFQRHSTFEKNENILTSKWFWLSQIYHFSDSTFGYVVIKKQ